MYNYIFKIDIYKILNYIIIICIIQINVSKEGGMIIQQAKLLDDF